MERVVLPRARVNRPPAEAQHAAGGRTLGVVGAVGAFRLRDGEVGDRNDRPGSQRSRPGEPCPCIPHRP